MPSSHSKRKRYEQALVANGVSMQQVGVLSLFDDSGSLLVGLFGTAFVYERVAPLAPPDQLHELTVAVLSGSAIALSLIGIVFASDCLYGVWRRNENWCRLLLQLGRVARTLLFFLCGHFVYQLASQYIDENNFSLFESLLLIPLVVVFFYYIVCLLQPDSAQRAPTLAACGETLVLRAHEA